MSKTASSNYDSGSSGRVAQHVAARRCNAGETERLVSLLVQVADEEGWMPGDGLYKHVTRSVYFGAWACSGDGEELVGGLQLALPDRVTGALPSDSVWPELVGDAAQRRGKAHIVAMAVRRDWRGRFGDLFWHLEVQLWRHCVLTGITEITLETTPRTLACYRRFGWPLQVIGGLKEHWGEPCLPLKVEVQEAGGAIAAKALRSASYWNAFERGAKPSPQSSLPDDLT